jgi:hypothetical protein
MRGYSTVPVQSSEGQAPPSSTRRPRHPHVAHITLRRDRWSRSLLTVPQ